MDPYRYLPFVSRKVMQAWAEREQPPAEVAWSPLARPLPECCVALISTAGVAPRDDEPFDQQGERDDPWWGDPSWRAVPLGATAEDVAIHHLHIDATPAQTDLDVVLPMRRLASLAGDGVIRAASGRHFSIMGYVLDATELVDVTAPEVARALADDGVDLVLLVPV